LALGRLIGPVNFSRRPKKALLARAGERPHLRGRRLREKKAVPAPSSL